MTLIAMVSGGTGGHSFPARSLAELALKKNHQVMVICEQRGRDYFSNIKNKNFTIKILSLAKPTAGKIFSKLWTVLSLLSAIAPTYFWLKNHRPDILVGFGGYMMFPAFIAGRLLKIPVVFLEQNARIGRANRFFQHQARAIALGFEHCDGLDAKVKNKCHVVGTPIKAEFFHRKRKNNEKNTLRIFITGGSQGAKVFAHVIPPAIINLQKNIPSKLKISVHQQAHREQVSPLQKFYKKHKIPAVIKPFFINIPDELSRADIFIGRAGASTIAEISAVGIASILIPYPYATDQHQYHNAMQLVKKNATRLILERQQSQEKIIADVSSQLLSLAKNPAKRKMMAKKIQTFAKKNASDDLLSLLTTTRK